MIKTNYSNPRFCVALQELEDTIKSGNFSAEGIESLIQRVMGEATPDTYPEEIVIYALVDCWASSKENSEKFLDLIIDKIDEDLFKKALQNLSITLSLECTFIHS